MVPDPLATKAGATQYKFNKNSNTATVAHFLVKSLKEKSLLLNDWRIYNEVITTIKMKTCNTYRLIDVIIRVITVANKNFEYSLLLFNVHIKEVTSAGSNA